MKYEGIRKINEGRFITRYDVDYVTEEGHPKTYEIISRNKNIGTLEQLFTGYDVEEFERLFDGKPVARITTAGVDGLLEPFEDRADFLIRDEDFGAFAAWYLHFAEKRELLGHPNHLLYICRKT